VASAAVAILLASGCLHAREIWDRDWIEARTKHFVLVSAISRKKTLALARRLEDFRARLVLLTSPQRVNTREPITVYVFRRSLPEIGLTPELGGYFLPSPPSNIIVLRRNWIMGEWAQHEYVHFLLRNRNFREYPPWFDEGMAVLLSTMEMDEGYFNFGKPPRYAMSRLDESPWLEYSDVLALRDPRDLNGVQMPMFYYQSWLLLHYLNWGRPERDLSRDIDDYLRRVRMGTAADSAFAASFDIEIDSLPTTLLAYRRTVGYLQARFVAPEAEAEIAVRRLPPAELATGIGEISLRRGELATAKRYFQAALSLHGNNPGAQIGMAEVRRREAIGPQPATR
jgi:hypothetical protein